MDYIINPMWFYWLQVVDGLNGCMFAACVIVGIAFAVSLCWYITARFPDDREFDELGKVHYVRLGKKFSIGFGVAFFILMIAAILIPSKETLVSMMIAKFATYNNAQLTVDTIKSAVDYIVKAVQAAK